MKHICVRCKRPYNCGIYPCTEGKIAGFCGPFCRGSIEEEEVLKNAG